MSLLLRPCFVFTLGLLSCIARGADDRPNIVYILADDLGYGDVGCYNPASKIPTPRLDRLAAEGRWFTDAHAADTVCTPSRYSILTGRYSFRTRLKHGVLEPFGSPLIDRDRLTLPSLLREAGYATAAFGKWHLGWNWPTRDGKVPEVEGGNVRLDGPIPDGPTARGFDRYFGVDIPNFPPYGFIAGNRMPVLPTVPAPMTPGRMHRPGPMVPGWKLEDILPEVTRHAVQYIEQAPKGRPFFLYFAMTAPHYPIVPTAEFKGKSRAGDYGDYVVEVDAMAGRVLDALDRAKQSQRTLVIFSSDNGPEVIEVDPAAYERKRLYDHSSMGELRGAKRDAWEGGHRVPYVVRWPGQVPAGTRSSELVCEMDTMRSLADLLHLKIPAGMAEDSEDIVPAWLGAPHAAPVRPSLVIHTGNNHYGIRAGHWVFIDAPTGYGNGPRGQEPAWYREARGYRDDTWPGELYDLNDDLPQRRNRYGDHPETVARLKALLAPYEAASRKVTAMTRGVIPDE